MPDLSLAQFVAWYGGITTDSHNENSGELANIREVSSKLHGKNAVWRKDGTPVDEIIAEVMSAGYSVTPHSFLHFLEQDLIAWTEGSDRGRVLRDIDATEATKDTDYLEHVAELHEEATCEICACPRNHDTHKKYLWEHDHLETKHVAQLRGESRNALYLSLFHFIYQERRYK